MILGFSYHWQIHPPKRDIVGIFSRSSIEDYSWLVKQLTSEHFRNQIQEVRPCYISNNGFQTFLDNMSQCTFGILYHTKNRGRINITDVTDSLYDEELEYLQQMLGKDNVIVIIDDLQDSSNKERTRILENQPKIGKLARDLCLISHAEKDDEKTMIRKLKSIFCHPSEHSQQEHPMSQRSKTINEAPKPSRLVIVIFSILEDGCVQWLGRLLSSFGHQHVTFHRISPHDNKGFGEAAFRCDIAVLYHTMRSGGFPVNHQGESLYYKVLQQLSGKLGKENVVVVIDDLEDTNDKERMQLMNFKPDIESLAGGLCILSHEDKQDESKLVQKLKTTKQFHHHSEHFPKSEPAQPTSRRLPTYRQKIPTPLRSAIGIFSVLEEGHIKWLRQLLSSDVFGQQQITYHGMSSYYNAGLDEEILQCKFAILYHSLKTEPPLTHQGHFLYQKAVEQLAQKLGKNLPT
ncbi:uncharacterized protein [Pyxicephalus adspersus]|uniref:uncharacterized protein n=1 Tax=Pyxicephalus adspersus TaxID=30357 RepID=UPI003B58E125